jgi:hypothetical protein
LSSVPAHEYRRNRASSAQARGTVCSAEAIGRFSPGSVEGGAMNMRTANQISGLLGMLAGLWALFGDSRKQRWSALEDPDWGVCGGAIPQLPAPFPGHWSKAQGTRQALQELTGPGCWQATPSGRVRPVTRRERTSAPSIRGWRNLRDRELGRLPDQFIGYGRDQSVSL